MATNPGLRHAEPRWSAPPRQPPVPPEPRAAARSPAVLVRVIESEVIPRLLMAHQTDPRRAAPVAIDATVIAPEDIDALALITLRRTSQDMVAHLEPFLTRGVPLPVVLVDLLGPVGRRLGEWWEEDRCDFIEVTMGLWRLQEVVHELASLAPAAGRAAERAASRALFATCPGDQHTLGAVIAEELFRRAGWETESAIAEDGPTLFDRVGEQAFDMVGLTVGNAESLRDLAATVASLRACSRNPRVVVMVGGAAFAENPALAIKLGADGTAPNAALAVAKARALVDAAARVPAGHA